ncbi:MAG: hypothetical protein GX610_13760 [Rhodococcus sp.]|nr:hypothetical protein [Rhodococcus sp. (in: high G+C Gram-positive bacteria)]
MQFKTVNGGWRGSFGLTVPNDLATREPVTTDEQMQATATELVEILAEFKGPDHTPTPY